MIESPHPFLKERVLTQRTLGMGMLSQRTHLYFLSFSFWRLFLFTEEKKSQTKRNGDAVPFHTFTTSAYSTTTGDSGALLRMLSMPLRQPALAL